MNKDLKIDYLRRLFYPFKKDGKLDSFVFHYLQGSGNELKEKFWSPRSSSRLCFDLYSWMGSDDGYSVIQFEKKLPGIKSGARQISPNMDVYFESGNEIVFIESKYTETALNKNYLKDLPEAYWNTDQVYLSVSGKKVNYSIGERYHNKKKVFEVTYSVIKVHHIASSFMTACTLPLSAGILYRRNCTSRSISAMQKWRFVLLE